MLRRLVEADIASCVGAPATGRARFWLLETRTASMLIELARRFPRQARRLAGKRPALRQAVSGGSPRGVEAALRREERRERAADRRYWAPLRAELERWRQSRALDGA